MGAFSVWHWAIALVVVGIPVWILIRALRERRSSPSGSALVGIGGWLAFLAFGLCVGLLRNIVDFIGGFSDYLSGFQNPDAHVQLVLVGLVTVVHMVVNLLAIVALFQKRRVLRPLYLILWGLSVLVPASALLMLTVPGVTPEMLFTGPEVARGIAGVVAMGLWYWYLSVSVRVKNTLTN